nr:TIR domain-containing protein [uncultured Draconibacterium sp.]
MIENRNRVFISYNHQDSSIAHRISDSLERENIDVVFDYKDISIGENVFDQIRYMYQTSETVMVLLSESLFASDYFRFEFPKYFFDEARKRKVNIIPVLVEKCQIPSDFLEYDIVNLTNDFEKGLQRIVQKLKIIPEISFDMFSPMEFEEFTYDLLKAYGFKNIQREQRLNDFGIDFIAESFNKDAFGFPNKEVWMIETKFYKQERFSINSLHRIIESFHYINKEDARILLITNSVLTSVAEEYIQEVKRERNIDIKILDGAKLKKVVSKRKRLLNKYFLR